MKLGLIGLGHMGSRMARGIEGGTIGHEPLGVVFRKV